jgi:4-amino-4-deoxy-L-arabinose transferase
MPLPGTLHVAGVALLLAVAWRLAATGRRRPALACVLLGGLLVRGFAAADAHLHEWDERYHALVAKNLRAHPLTPTLYEHPLLPYDYRESFANHVWLHKPPLALWTIAVSLALLGLNEAAVRLPSLLVSTGSVLLTYRLGALVFDARVGLLASMLHATSGVLIELACGRRATDHVDTLFIGLVELGMWAAFRSSRTATPLRWAPLVGVVTGMAVLTKWLPALLVLAVWAVLLRGRTGRGRAVAALAVAAACAAAVALPWDLHARAAFPAEYAWERGYDVRHVSDALERHEGGPFFHLFWMGRFFGELVYLPVAWFLYRTARERSPDHVALALWLAAPYLVFSLVATKMEPYPMIAAPAIFLVVAWYWWRLRERLARMRARGLAIGVLSALVVLPVRSAFERVRPFAVRREPAWARDLRALGTTLGSARCALFNVPRPIEAMFYTPCTSYASAPTKDLAERLVREGYLVLVRRGDDERLPPDVRRRTDIRFVDLSP